MMNGGGLQVVIPRFDRALQTTRVRDDIRFSQRNGRPGVVFHTFPSQLDLKAIGEGHRKDHMAG